MIPKYRAWDKKNKIMIDFESTGIDSYELILFTIDGKSDFSISFDNYEDDTKYFPSEQFILLPYIGVTDGGGMEVYKGDVIFNYTGNSLGNYKDGRIGVVKESKYGGCWDLISHGIVNGISRPKWKVIGNIYQNPELLEGIK